MLHESLFGNAQIFFSVKSFVISSLASLEDRGLLCLLTCCENLLCEKKLCNGVSCYDVQFEYKVIAKALKTWVWAKRASPRL